MFLLDTPAISEIDKSAPNPGLVDWLSTVDVNDLYLSAISIGELRQGIARLPNGPKRRALEANFELIQDRFSGRILPIDFAVAERYGTIQAEKGPLPVMDTLIAATAIVHRLTIVTRNTKDLGRTGARILDPWN